MFRKAVTLGAPPFVPAYLVFALGMTGDRDGAMKELKALERMSPKGRVLPFNLALVYLGVDDRARAAEYLDKAHVLAVRTAHL